MRRDILRAPERHEGRQGPSETGLLLCLGAGVVAGARALEAAKRMVAAAGQGEGLGDGASLGSAFEGRPSMTPPVRTVVFPPSYGVTSIFDLSTNTRAWRARSRLDCFFALDASLEPDEDVLDENVPQEVRDSSELQE